MKTRILKKLYSLTKEDLMVIVFGVSFFVGVWYAIPMVNTITDVWSFGGGVLRAMEAHTLFPGGDVPYGTISFFQNYIAMAFALAAGFVFTGFDLEALKTLLILNPSYTLIPSRIVSVLTSIVLLAVVYRFLKAHVTSSWWRFALIVLVFGNVLASLLVRSGKMWMLSTALGVISFIYLYRALTEERTSGISGRSSVISVVTAFLATANFPFAAVFLINIPILFLFFPKTAKSLRRLFLIVLSGGAVFLSVVALNFQNTFQLVSSFITPLLQPSAEIIIDDLPALSFFEAFLVNARHAVEAFPLLFLALLFVVIPAAGWRVRDKTLAYLALTYGVIYILMASVLFRSDHGLSLNVRHIFPLAFFLLFCIVAYRAPARSVAVGFISIGLLIYMHTMALFSVPTTYNDVSDFLTARYGTEEVLIKEDIFELTLPMNRASYEIFAEENCGSTCKHRRTLDADIEFNPLVVTNYTDQAVLEMLAPVDIVVLELSIPGCTPIARFGNSVPDTEVFDFDINLGRMLMPSFYTLRQLGKNMYVYDVSTCPSSSKSAI
ncbi:MAG: hypothetical protein ACI9VM_000022 [Candidatus Azotimanducaceae bacterium]|jgi:hypothetical protein